MAPRFFWRRVASLVIELVIASLISTLLVLPFLGNTDKLRLSGGLFTETRCGSVTSLPPETAAQLPANIDQAVACQSRVYGIENGLSLTVIFDRVVTEHTTSQKSVSVPINAQGMVVWPWSPDSLVNLILLTIVSAFALARWGRTPGKYLLGLTLSRPVSFGAAVARESLHLWPLHLTNISFVTLPFYGPNLGTLMSSIGLMGFIGFGLVVLILFLLCYLLPVIRWRGQMPWDRLIGAQIVLRGGTKG